MVSTKGRTTRAVAVSGLSAIALAVSGCSGGSEAEAEKPVGFPKLTTTWVSPTNGFSFRHMEERGPTPATKPWDPVIDPPVNTSSRYDDPFDLWETGYAAFFKSASTPIPERVSIDEWVDEHVSPGGCGGPRSQQAEINIDGRSGRIAECPKATEADVNRIEATVVAGDRLYLFILLSDRSDYREVFDYFASTIDLRPEAASGSDPEAEFSAAFKKDFSTAPWIDHITGVKLSSEYSNSLVVTTDLHKASDTLTGTSAASSASHSARRSIARWKRACACGCAVKNVCSHGSQPLTLFVPCERVALAQAIHLEGRWE